MTRGERDTALEALRGIAAVMVLLWHTMLGFFPGRAGIFPGFEPARSLSGQLWFGLVHGTAAVAFFFVLSGFVLTRHFFKTGHATILLRGALKRWPRLAGPVVIVALLSWALFIVGLYPFEEAARLTGSPWLERFAYAYETRFVPGFWDAFSQGVFYTFFRGDAYYDSSLWTMRYEFIGSFIAFGIALLMQPARERNVWMPVVVAGVAVLICHYASPLYAAFPIGVALAAILPFRRVTLPIWSGGLLIVTAIYLWGYTGSSLGAFGLIHGVLPAETPIVYVHVTGAILVIMAAETSPALRRMLSGRWAARLGELSFPLYLIHVLVLCSVGCAALLASASIVPSPYAQVAAAVATIVASFIAAVPLGQFNRWWVDAVNRVVSCFQIAPALPNNPLSSALDFSQPLASRR